MRIVYIQKHIAQFGGMDRVVSFKMNWLAQHGHDVHLITYEQGNHPISFPLDKRIEHTDVNVRFFTRHGGGLLKRMRQFLQMRRMFRKRVYSKVKAIDPDVIVTLTDSYTLLDILQRIPGRAYRVIESHVEHDSIQKRLDFKGRFGLYQFASFFDWYITRQIKRADCLVVLTQHDAIAWSEVKNVKVIPNPLCLDSQGRSQLSEKRVISVGRLEPQKGYDILIDVWAKVVRKHPGWILSVYGDGALRSALEEKTRACGLEGSIRWEHATSDIAGRYIESSLYVMSSRYEGFGLVLTEAMSCGVPCISFDCPYGPSDIIHDGEDGVLVPLGDKDAMADAICHLMEDETLRKSMGDSAFVNARRYAPNRIMKEWDALFENALRT